MTPENSLNPFLNLNYDPALEALGDDFFDEVAAAEFPKHILRFRNDELLPKLGLKPEEVTDENFIEAFGKFQGRKPFLALRYHGYQFGEYNSRLGDGRGFLYGQVRGTDGELYDFGTKGSGTTPYSRGGDGRLTLKGGVREVLASEALYYLGVYTSRCLSMIETGDALWRGDEPSPTRSSVMVRFSRSHIRFGTFERLHNFGRKDLIQQLLDHVILQYYPHLKDKQDRYALFYAELVQRVARLVAQWMSVGFCHAVLNTDNMSITGESFDYGPFAFIDTYNPQFTAAYFDYYGRYSYGNQPGICKLNLEMLQDPLSAVIPVEDMDVILKEFDEHYYQTYNERMLNKLGFANLAQPEAEELLMSTVTLLQKTQVGYHTFFSELTEQFNRNWRDDAANILKSDSFLNSSEATGLLEAWRNLYLQILLSLPESEMDNMLERLQRYNPKTVLLRPEIEAVWEKIDQEDNWELFYQLISRLRFHQDAA
ncbi:protein adenylyltransferase SelO [Funiculus sociatus]|uniref:protein adenylyltransferase SelO n=1 Tax=Funiculus sociatus TaxID=450527 RepID=UPI00329708D6